MEKFIVFAGPCVIESKEHCLKMSGILKEITDGFPEIEFYYKSSFLKANRTSLDSYKGPGLKGLHYLAEAKKKHGIKIITDIHEESQAEIAAATADIIQIPALLCRQTSLLVAAAKTGRIINIKKGQWCAPHDMKYIVEKITKSRPDHIKTPIYICERGTSFGYNNLVVDFTGISTMRAYAPVIFDATHAVQKPGGAGGKSTGNRAEAMVLARCAAAAEVDGLFCEVHDDPDNALSDGPNSLTIEMFENILPEVLAIRRMRVRAEKHRAEINKLQQTYELKKFATAIGAKKEVIESIL